MGSQLERLERSNRQLRVAVLSLGVLVALLAVFGPGFLRTKGAIAAQKPAEKVLRVQRLELVNAQGKTLAVLGLTKNGDAALTLWGKNGKHLTIDPWTLQPRTRLASARPIPNPPPWGHPGTQDRKSGAWIIPLQQAKARR